MCKWVVGGLYGQHMAGDGGVGHGQFFITDRETLSFVFALAGPSLARARQILGAVAGRGGTAGAFASWMAELPDVRPFRYDDTLL